MKRAEWDAKNQAIVGVAGDSIKPDQRLLLMGALFGPRPGPCPPAAAAFNDGLNVCVVGARVSLGVRGVAAALPEAHAASLRNWLSEYLTWKDAS